MTGVCALGSMMELCQQGYTSLGGTDDGIMYHHLYSTCVGIASEAVLLSRWATAFL
jgi:hypothetical protein